jgi:hypothetical protein
LATSPKAASVASSTMSTSASVSAVDMNQLCLGWTKTPRANMWATPSCSSSRAIDSHAATIGTAENQNVPVTKNDPAASRRCSAPSTAAIG